MKRILLFIAGMLLACPLFSQAYQPRETWPFLYESFQSGVARTLDGTLTTEARFNIAVHDGTLMYIGKDGTIMRADMTRVYTARVGDDVYYNIMGRMYKVLSELDRGVVVLCSAIDVDQQNKTNIGYGISSATASAQNVTLAETDAFNFIGKKIEQSELDKFHGNVLPVKETVYLKIGTLLIPASRREVLAVQGVDKKAANAFFKQEKIKWNDIASLEKVLVFVDEQLKQNQY